MRITFEPQSTNQNVDRATTSYRDTCIKKTDKAGGYALDISGTVMDNNAYRGQGKTAEEVMQDAGLIDVAAQRDYMTVMSNIMSGEDFAQMQKEGYHPGDMEIEDVVTIVDKIKSELVKGGTTVAGYTDDLDAEKLSQITGSEAFARELLKQFTAQDIPVTSSNVEETVKAFDRALALQKLNEGTVKYMVENDMEPTIDNLYLAEHSAIKDNNRQAHGYFASDQSGYYAKKAEEYNWDQLKPQIERVIEEAGLADDKESYAQAQWLIQSGIPFTKKTLMALNEIGKIDIPMERDVILHSIASSIADGKNAGSANLSDGRSNLEKAVACMEAVSVISDEAVDQTVADGKKLTISNLYKEQSAMDYLSFTDDNPKQITARRQLEEVRLVMTIEANRKLIASGFSIDTMELTQLVEALKEMEKNAYSKLFHESENIAAAQADLFAETQSKLREIPYLPIDIIGQAAQAATQATDSPEEERFTLDYIYETGVTRRNVYEQAKESYETLMTVPRSDLGDSIKEAFRNVDDILMSMNLETSEENRRVLRILGYNSMDITYENIDIVKKYDMDLRSVIRKMTPSATLQTIRDGKNPLQMSIAELNDYLDNNSEQTYEKEEKFSRFLYKLDKKHEVTKQEREALIGIYRMFRQLEKADDAAVGELVKEGSALTFRNLLTAMRSGKKKGMDYTVDDYFTGMDSINLGKSISSQIMSGYEGYYSQLSGEIAHQLEPEKLLAMNLYPDMTMEQFAEELARQEADEESNEAFEKEQLQDYRNLALIDDQIVQELMDYEQPVSVNYLYAMSELKGQYKNREESVFSRIKSYAGPEDRHHIEEKIKQLLSGMSDREETTEAYKDLHECCMDVLESAKKTDSVSYLDLKALKSLSVQLSLSGNLAQEENYYIPVEIGGEYTTMNLKILHGTEAGKVSAVMQTEEFGQIAAQFCVRNNILSGYVSCNSGEGINRLQQKKSVLYERLEAMAGQGESSCTIGDIGFVQSRDVNIAGYQSDDLINKQIQSSQREDDGDKNRNEAVSTSLLYRTAKAFVQTMMA